MFDIGFWELLIIAIVLLLVMGPERLPEVAKQAAFLVRKARQGMFRLRSEMKNELDGTPFSDLQKAKEEMANFKNDIKQFGRDLADSAEEKVGDDQKPATPSIKPDEALSPQQQPSAESVSGASKQPSAQKEPSE